MSENSNTAPRPKFIYGTAWKEKLTQECVFTAVKAGYRAIDTANQLKHYFEEGVGNGLEQAMKEFNLVRDDFFLQTKFTYERGQDHRLPYDEKESYSVKVQQSIESSLNHLKTDHLDSYILHGPSGALGISDEDLEVWSQMEKAVGEGTIKYLGASNISSEQINELCKKVTIKPAYVQNRSHATNAWDTPARETCRALGIHYQGFSILTGSAPFIGGTSIRRQDRKVPSMQFGRTTPDAYPIHPWIKDLLEKYQCSPSCLLFSFARQEGMIPLTGTTNEENMISNLNDPVIDLTEEERQKILSIKQSGQSL